MLFNSLDFAIFLLLVFILYWFVTNKSLTYQNALIVLASYVFYAWWDWRFLVLIALSTLVDFYVAKGLQCTTPKRQRKGLLLISLFFNLGLLGFFKYFNFFIESWVDAWAGLGISMEVSSLNIILPVGISFYTFQTLSYTIDVYRGKMKATDNLLQFTAYVAFFPQLVAGPIERASHLLPQFTVLRKFDYAKAIDGLRQILWGLFKKVVIADNCATYVNIIFDNHTDYSASTLFVGVVMFSFQIYGDFSGYSDIAIGTSRLLGFDLKQNFAYPYFSRDVAEFWRRWHISLSTWFRDYLYIPLGGSKGNKSNQISNVFLIFLVSGLWHGANWTFVIWGALNALYFLPLLLLKRNRLHTDVVAEFSKFPTIKELFKMTTTFLLILISWVFFRAESLPHAFDYFSQMFDMTIVSIPQIRPKFLFVFILVFLLIEWWGRRDQYAIERLWLNYPKAVRWSIYYCIAMAIFLYGGKTEEFIYFQF